MTPNPFIKQYLMTAGPTPVPPAVSQAMAAPMLALHHGLRGGLRLAEALRDVRGGAVDGDPATLAGALSLVALGAA